MSAALREVGLPIVDFSAENDRWLADRTAATASSTPFVPAITSESVRKGFPIYTAQATADCVCTHERMRSVNDGILGRRVAVPLLQGHRMQGPAAALGGQGSVDKLAAETHRLADWRLRTHILGSVRLPGCSSIEHRVMSIALSTDVNRRPDPVVAGSIQRLERDCSRATVVAVEVGVHDL